MRLEPHPNSDGYKVRLNDEESRQFVSAYDEKPRSGLPSD